MWRTRAQRWPAVVAVASVVLTGPACAQARPWTALVVNDLSTSSSVSAIDTSTQLAAPPVAVGSTPLGIAVTPDARTAYVADVNSATLTPLTLTAAGAVARAPLDLAVDRGGARPLSKPAPAFVAISPDGRLAYISDPANDRVVPVDLTTSPPKVGAGIRVGNTPTGIAFTPDGRRAYVADNADDGAGPAVTPIDVLTGRAGPAITGVGPHPYALAITPDGRTAYVADAGPGSAVALYPVTLATGTAGPAIAAGAGDGEGIAITPDGRTAYVTTGGPDVVPVTLRPGGGTAGAPITVGGATYAVAFTPDGAAAYVSDGSLSGTTVHRVTTASGTVGPTITVASTPRAIAVTPDQAPAAALSVTPRGPGAPTSFDASASTVRFGAIARYDWDFGDGSAPVTTTLPAVTHVYARPGLRTATVRETDTAGTSTDGGALTGPSASRTPSGGAAASVTFASGASGAAPPVTGKTVVVAPTSGIVTVRARGSRTFTRLRTVDDVPVGSELDTRRGSVTLTVATNARHATDSATVSGGRFTAAQSRGTDPRTTFALTAPLACPRHPHPSASIARTTRRTHRRTIKVKETRGNFATKGRYVAGSVQGTRWQTTDTCASSTLAVTQGLVRVTDLTDGSRRTLGAGQSFTARP